MASYKKNHSPSTESIPEDQEVTSYIKVIKPIDGVETQKVTPIIKMINNPSVKLSPLDLEPNDYFGEPVQKFPDSKNNTKDFKFTLDGVQLSARELNSKADQEILRRSSAKKRTTKVNIASDGSPSIDLDTMDLKISFDKQGTDELIGHLQSFDDTNDRKVNNFGS